MSTLPNSARPLPQVTANISELQGSAKKRFPGLVNFIPAVAYPFCLNLPAGFTQPGASTLADHCRRVLGDLCQLIYYWKLIEIELPPWSQVSFSCLENWRTSSGTRPRCCSRQSGWPRRRRWSWVAALILQSANEKYEWEVIVICRQYCPLSKIFFIRGYCDCQLAKNHKG